MKRYPIFSLQIINYQIDQIHKLNILLVKFYFKSFRNLIFVFSPYGIDNVNIYAFITQKMIWEPINCGSFLEKVYLRLL